MAVLKNARHERFAQAIASGETQSGAYETAGFKANRGNAVRLKANENVAARVEALQTVAAERVAFTIDDAVLQADEDRAFARELSQPAAASTASMAKFKLLGLITDKVQSEITERAKVPSRSDIEARRAAWDAKVAERTGARLN